ncbi:Detected protein of unknown function [Hibiscus syriacus]|uniref:Molybdopterin cofactor biosynthesis C (MoaC) domain-containing protein n=1 Tax=Hibiscus syriacus TaxID=106335 RepID=A0A6A2ZZ47_HIBSY|nr:Detected protein of unknown function [Hibiscus syriacus]
MESVFGDLPPDGLANSGNRSLMAQESQHNSHVHLSSTNDKFTAQELNSISHNLGEKAPGLTHVGSTGKAQMVDVSPKENSSRTAIASCKVLLGKKVFDLVLANQMAKGDVLLWQKLLAINGAKHTRLTVYDMCKAASKDIQITDVQLERKTGGKSGYWCREE